MDEVWVGKKGDFSGHQSGHDGRLCVRLEDVGWRWETEERML